MYPSRSFLSRSEKCEDEAALEALFLRLLPQLPAGLGEELFAYVASGDNENPHQLLADMVDLFWMQYDDAAAPLSREDWSLIRDVIDEHAQDLDLELIQYVMERVVSHHAI